MPYSRGAACGGRAVVLERSPLRSARAIRASMLIDSHCHLEHRAFPEGPDAVLDRARAADVRACVVVGVSGLAAAEAALEICNRRSDVVITAGGHPHDAAEFGGAIGDLERVFGDDRVVAVGEVGLDFHYDYSPREIQRRVFRESIALARRLRRPLVIHSRAAADETIELLEQEGAREVGGVIHCFSEDRAFAERALDLGFDLSFSGIVTFKNARPIHEVAVWAPRDRILVETDSPYLAPLPLRGKRCEPAYVVHTAQRVADLRGMSLEELAALTTANACRRFGPRLAQAAGVG